MFALQVSYRGRSRRRAAEIRSIASVFERSIPQHPIRMVGADTFQCLVDTPDQVCSMILSLLQTGDFALSLSTLVASAQDIEEYYDTPEELHEHLYDAASRAMSPQAKVGTVSVRIENPGPGSVLAPGVVQDIAADIVHTFSLLAHILTRRTKEGREATALLRSGLSQSEAAEQLGISKQAMSQRLTAAGWHAEQAGWTLGTHMLQRARILFGH